MHEQLTLPTESPQAVFIIVFRRRAPFLVMSLFRAFTKSLPIEDEVKTTDIVATVTTMCRGVAVFSAVICYFEMD